MRNLFTCLSKKSLSNGNGSMMDRQCTGDKPAISGKLFASILFLLLFGIGNAWGAAKTVKYNVATISSVTVDETINDKPDGSSATFSNTYTSTKEQMTGGNYQTLTLSSYGVVAVVNITLSMKSNSGSGAGIVKYSTDGGSTWTYIVGSWDSTNSRESGVSFASDAFGKGYSTSYKNVSFTAPFVTEGSKNLVIRVHSTENSIFCQSYQLTYTTEKYTLTYNSGSGTCGTSSEKQGSMGAVLTLPSASPNDDCAEDGWTFIGWAKSSCTETGEKPTLYAASSSYIPVQDETLYAVYKIGESYTIDFESASSAYTDWTFTNMTSKQDADITAHGGSYYGTTGGTSTASIETKSAISPKWIKFYVSKASGNTTESYWKVQTKTIDGDWTDRKSHDAKGMSKGTWQEVTQDLSSYSDVYVRIWYGSNTAVRTIDDLELSCVTYNSNPDCVYDWFIDIMHDNETIEKQGSYSMPSALSDASKGATYCDEKHYHFLGWVEESEINDDGTLKSGYTLYPAGHSGHTAANTTYYAVWGEEK